jgi:hypothetical protein
LEEAAPDIAGKLKGLFLLVEAGLAACFGNISSSREREGEDDGGRVRRWGIAFSGFDMGAFKGALASTAGKGSVEELFFGVESGA